eukprot:c55033_g1_i1.p1 GENE.c55033_g1_i1~~c55033_g1_i1.p1  ORF type:complete len:150 (-),score=16.35 c55033_g1_i1:91-540(-)
MSIFGRGVWAAFVLIQGIDCDFIDGDGLSVPPRVGWYDLWRPTVFLVIVFSYVMVVMLMLTWVIHKRNNLHPSSEIVVVQEHSVNDPPPTNPALPVHPLQRETVVEPGNSDGPRRRSRSHSGNDKTSSVTEDDELIESRALAVDKLFNY